LISDCLDHLVFLEKKKCVFSELFSVEERRPLFHLRPPSLPHSFQISSYSSFFLSLSLSSRIVIETYFSCFKLNVKKELFEFHQQRIRSTKFVSILRISSIFLGFFFTVGFLSFSRMLNLKELFL